MILEAKIIKKNSKYYVISSTGRNMGKFTSKKSARERVRQLGYFSSINENVELFELWNY